MAREGRIFGARDAKSNAGNGVIDNEKTTKSARTNDAKKLTFDYVFSTPNVHPYDEVTWEQRDVVMTNWRDGSVSFE